MPRFSVIIPVYNVEKYLDRCVYSVVNQTFKNMEIILVDDGSPDHCPAMCDAWAERDPRIKVIHKKNGGLGFARNSGIEMAVGDYISFIDSDDTVSSDMFGELDVKLTAEPTDICYFGRNSIRNGKIIYTSNLNYPSTCYGQQVRELVLPCCFGGSWLQEPAFEIGAAWCGVYKRTLFENGQLRFKAGLIEDVQFTMQIVAKIDSVSFINKPLYHYYYNKTSLTKSYRADRFKKTTEVYKLMCSVIEQEKYPEEYLIRAKSFFLSHVIACLKQEYSRDTERCNIGAALKSICSSDVLQEVLKDFPLKKVRRKRRFLFLAIKHKQLLPVKWMVWYQVREDRHNIGLILEG